MFQLFLILAPGLLAAVLHRELRHSPMTKFDFIITSLIYAFFISAFCFGVIYLRGFGDLAPLAVFNNLRSVTKYCVIASVMWTWPSESAVQR